MIFKLENKLGYNENDIKDRPWLLYKEDDQIN